MDQEPALTFVKSSYSNNDCVEVAAGANVYVRDSKDEGKGLLAASPDAWRALLDSLR
ncbi:DUF397 domain-containing protein [Streptomyces hoynatensis]|uniref:DUF397 domain-containing protein n=1 Tax=Streptomyces hoynatensis TaxID=1141874 RepID=A0A3A9YFN9_9ACTN|nr:DUF397 domain-containing protein [Streptomyces hoynatensis]RKN35922.1 DUF397 domain-containing protein [Streptomyces hoynatensis]